MSTMRTAGRRSRPGHAPLCGAGRIGLAADSSADASLPILHVEVDQQTDALLRKAQIREQLRFVNRQDRLDGLDLHDDGIVDENIDSVSELDPESVILCG